MEGARCPACGAATHGAATCPECGLNLEGGRPSGPIPPEALRGHAPSDDELDRAVEPATTEYALRLAWTAAFAALVVPPVAFLAWAFAAIAIWRGQLGAGVTAIIAAAVTSTIGGVIWTLILT